MSVTPKFKQIQYAFSAHIRNPDDNPAPDDIEQRRMAIYNELFFNNIQSFLDSSFPVLKEISSAKYWNSMTRKFLATHYCQSPVFLDIPKEFLLYLENEHQTTQDDPAFLYELAHYEWAELALSIAEDDLDYSKIDPNGDMLAGTPIISPLAWPLAYEFPVHQISADYQPKTAPQQATFLVVYRDRTDTVGFLEINAVTARLLELISEINDQTISGRDLLMTIATELKHSNPATVIEAGSQILNSMHAAGVLLGTDKTS